MKRFLDTNILVYAFSEDQRAIVSRRIMADDYSISAQVLNEFVNVAQRKYKISWDLIDDAVDKILQQATECISLTDSLNAKARSFSRVHALPFYDALILAAALQAECDELVTEDFHNGQRFGSLTIVNPFV
jgi:predicted nucleic acid-binding protein